jgi:hypothetical protein
MTQSSKPYFITTVRFTKPLYFMSLFAVLFVMPLQAAHQLELNLGTALGETDYGNNNYTSIVHLLRGYYIGEFAPSEKIGISIKERFEDPGKYSSDSKGMDAVTGASSRVLPFSERNIRGYNDAALGLRYTGPFELMLSYRNFYFINPRPLEINQKTSDQSSYYYDVNDSGGMLEFKLKRQMRNIAQANVLFPVNNLSLSANVIPVSQNYAMQSWRYVTETDGYDSLARTQQGFDLDLWWQAKAEYSFPADIVAGGGARVKNNLSGRDLYNIYRYNLFVRGTQEFPAQNKITWELDGRWYRSDIMALSTYADGLAFDLYLRDVWMFAYGLYLKGMANVTVGKYWMLKQRYELALRKAFRSESYVEAGYFLSNGGLFPMQGLYARATLMAREKLGLSIGGKVLIEGPDDKVSPMQIVRWDINPEVSFAVKPRLKMYFVPAFSGFNSSAASGFPSRFSVYAGIRSWNPE